MRWMTLGIFVLLLTQITAQAGDIYKIDPEHTFSSFEYLHWGLSSQRGRFDRNAGVIEYDAAAKTISIDIHIDTASVSTGSDAFDKVLKSDDFFDANAFPQMTFKSTSAQFDGDNLTQVSGDLTIKAVTLPVVMEISHFGCRFMLLYVRQACGANGSAKILRSDFGMGRYTPFVSDAVTLYFSVEGIKE